MQRDGGCNGLVGPVLPGSLEMKNQRCQLKSESGKKFGNHRLLRGMRGENEPVKQIEKVQSEAKLQDTRSGLKCLEISYISIH